MRATFCLWYITICPYSHLLPNQNILCTWPCSITPGLHVDGIGLSLPTFAQTLPTHSIVLLNTRQVELSYHWRFSKWQKPSYQNPCFIIDIDSKALASDIPLCLSRTIGRFPLALSCVVNSSGRTIFSNPLTGSINLSGSADQPSGPLVRLSTNSTVAAFDI